MILITGGAGYIGSHFVKFYLETHPGEEVVVVDNLSEGHREALSFSKAIHFVQEDIGNINGMKAIFTRYPINTIVHFAASCSVGESQKDPSKYFQNNVVKTLNLFKAMDNCNIRRLVFSSTCATYGNPICEPLDEQHPQNPINIYGLTKLMIEQALSGYCTTLGWSAIALRYFNASGADESGLIGEHHEPETHLIPLILRAAQGKSPAIEIYGTDYDTPDGSCIRDYIHVTDLAYAHSKAVERLETQTGFDAINLGTAYGASVKEVIDVCQDVTGLEIPVKIVPRREGDPPRLIANADKAVEKLNWRAQYDLIKIIETAWAWENSRKFAHHDPHLTTSLS
jgi:UDP-glucose 4-epimerase